MNKIPAVKTLIALTVALSLILCNGAASVEGASDVSEFALDLSADVLQAKGQDTEWTMEWFFIKRIWEKSAEYIGLKEELALEGLTPDGWESAWEVGMKKFLKAITVTLEVSTAIEKAAGGSYDEAALATAAAAAEYIGCPFIKVAVATISITNESYKQVQATGAARDVEALYGALDSDRLVLGEANAQSDTPALIPLDDATIETIYQKYIWENANTRSLVIAYFNTKGPPWPKEEWDNLKHAELMDAYSSDPARRAAVVDASNAFRKKAIPWIKILVKDVNAQARFRWSKMRLEQAAKNMAPYIQRMNAAKDEFAGLKSHFAKLKMMKDNIPEWQKWLSESPAALESAKKLLATPKKMQEAQQLCDTWMSRMRTATSGAHVIGETKLYEALKVQRQAWYDIEASFGGAAGTQQTAIMKDPTLVYTPATGEPIAEEKKIYQVNFEPLIKPYEFKPTPEALKAEILGLLNQGKIDEAWGIVSDPGKASKKIFDYYSSEASMWGNVTKAKDSINAEYQDRINELSAEYRNSQSPKDGSAIILWQQWRDTILAKIAKKQEEIAICNKAYDIAAEVIRALTETTIAEEGAQRREMTAIVGAAQQLRQMRRDQWGQYQGSVEQEVGRDLPIEAAMGKGTEYSSDMDARVSEIYTALSASLEKIKNEEKLVANAPFDYATSIGELYSQIQKRAEQIRIAPVDTEGVKAQMRLAATLFSQWQAAAERWKTVSPIPADELAEIRVFVDAKGAMEYEATRRKIASTINNLDAIEANIKKKSEECLRTADDITKERREGADWLNDKAREIKGFFKAQEDQKVLKNNGSDAAPDYEVVVEKDLDYGITNIPYRHYMLQADIAAYAQNVEKDWAQYAGFQFIKVNAPKVYEKLKVIATPKGIKPAPEENVIARTGSGANIVLWNSILGSFESAVDGVKYDASELQFSLQMTALQSVNGMGSAITSAVSGKKVPYAATDSYASYSSDYNNALGKRYIDILAKIQNTFNAREEYLKTQPAGPGGPGGPVGPDKPTPPVGPKPPTGPMPPVGPKPPIEPKQPVDPLSFYKLTDARINGNNLKSASGIVTLTNSDLKGNAIEFTARLNTIERIEKLLISAEDGRVWNELPLNQVITYPFTPMQNKLYQIAVKIKGTDMDELIIRPFDNIQGIQYQNVDYQQLVVNTMKKLAEVYENENVALFADIISRDFLGNRTFLEEGVRFDFDMFDNIRLQIFIDKIQIRSGLYVADTHWIKSQIPKKTGQQQRTSGYTTMTFALEDGKMKIQNLRGDLIYATLSPEIAETSGLSQAVVEEIAIAQQTRTPVQPGAGQTQETGGVVPPPELSPALTVRNGSITSSPPPPPTNVNGFSFSSGSQVGLNAGDFNYALGNQFNAVGAAQIQKVTGYSFDTLIEAPAGGYGAVAAGMVVGDVYAFITTSGKYGKMEVTSIVNTPPPPPPGSDNIAFRYAVQADGTRNIRTQ